MMWSTSSPSILRSDGDYNPLIAKSDSLVSLANDKKIVALAENGSIPDPDLLKSSCKLDYFTTWEVSSFGTDCTMRPIISIRFITVNM